MSTTYAQKQSPAQKKDAPSAASVLDASSQSEGLQRKADLINKTIQCYGAVDSFMINHIGEKNAWQTSLERYYYGDGVSFNSVITDQAYYALTSCQSPIRRTHKIISGVPCWNSNIWARTIAPGRCVVWVDRRNNSMFHIGDIHNINHQQNCEFAHYPDLDWVYTP